MSRPALPRLLAVCLAVAAVAGAPCAEAAQPPAAVLHSPTSPAMNQFANPIVPARGVGGSADPSVVFRDGYYYYCKSLDDRAIGVARAERLQDIGSVPMTTIWTPPPGTAYSEQIWAPELQYLQGRWYVYFAASDGHNANHRMFVLESHGDDPQAGYTFKGKIAAPTDRWAIDGLTLESHGKLYFLWSGWRGTGDGFPQVTYIAPLSNPWTIGGERHEIAAPDRPWEQSGAALMEGHAVLKHGDKLFVAYSASASWTDDYTLGLLEYTGGDILRASSWTKSASPVFAKLDHGGSFGPGHNSFVKSPDGTEDWIVYHAIDRSNGGWAERSVRAQRFGWGVDGRPAFGVPVASGVAMAEPSGTEASVRLARRSQPRRIETDAQVAGFTGAAALRPLPVVRGGASTSLLKAVSTAPSPVERKRRKAPVAEAVPG